MTHPEEAHRVDVVALSFGRRVGSSWRGERKTGESIPVRSQFLEAMSKTMNYLNKHANANLKRSWVLNAAIFATWSVFLTIHPPRNKWSTTIPAKTGAALRETEKQKLYSGLALRT